MAGKHGGSVYCSLLVTRSSKDYERIDCRFIMKNNLSKRWNFKASKLYKILRSLHAAFLFSPSIIEACSEM